jgi:hypothetical protein
LGIILGVLVKDISTLFTVIKSLGIFLYAPAFIFMFPNPAVDRENLPNLLHAQPHHRADHEQRCLVWTSLSMSTS